MSQEAYFNLPSFVYLLRQMQRNGREVVSVDHLSREFGADVHEVWRYLFNAGINCSPTSIHDLEELIEAIEKKMGWRNEKDAFIVGVGNLGRALVNYSELKRYGLNIVAGFDVDPEVLGEEIGGVTVLHLERMKDLAMRMHVRIGIVAVPADEAQAVAEAMIEGGIRIIWNFAPVHLKVPQKIYVHNESICSSLSNISIKMRKILSKET